MIGNDWDLVLENEFENNHTFNIDVNNNDIVLK